MANKDPKSKRIDTPENTQTLLPASGSKLSGGLPPVEDPSLLRKDKSISVGMSPEGVISGTLPGIGKKKGGKIKSASSRADGIASKGHTRGKYL